MPRNPVRVMIMSEIFGIYYIIFDGTYYTVRKKGVRVKTEGTGGGTEEKETICGKHGGQFMSGIQESVRVIIEDMMITKAKEKENKIFIITLEEYLKEYRRMVTELRELLSLIPPAPITK